MQKVPTSSTKYGRVAETCFSVFQNELRANYEGKYHFYSQGWLSIIYFWKWRYYPCVCLLIDCTFTCVFDDFVMLSVSISIVSQCIQDGNLFRCFISMIAFNLGPIFPFLKRSACNNMKRMLML